MAKIIGIIEYEINEENGDTPESLIEEAKKEFNYDVQDRCLIADNLKWKILEVNELPADMNKDT